MNSLVKTSPRCLATSRQTACQSNRDHAQAYLRFRDHVYQTFTSSCRHQQWPNKQPLKPHRKPSVSLFDELFPDTSTPEPKPTPKPTTPTPRSVPRLRLFEIMQERTDVAAGFKRERSPKTSKRRKAVVMFHHALTALAPFDFECLAPGSSHLDGWRAHDAKPVRAIQCRDATTLMPNGNYLLEFASMDAANAFMIAAREQHQRAAVLLRPTALEIETLTARYAVHPRGQKLSLKLLSYPYVPVVRELLAHGGYAAVAEGRRSEHEVLLWFPYHAPTIDEMQDAIEMDGEERGLIWRTVGPQFGLREVRVHHLANGNGGEEAAGKVGKRFLHRFVISFEDEDEAKRFVMEWHMRNLERTSFFDETTLERLEGATECRCEYIW